MSGDTVPNWVLTEVGRLHLHALALERALADSLAARPAPPTDEETSGADLA